MCKQGDGRGLRPADEQAQADAGVPDFRNHDARPVGTHVAMEATGVYWTPVWKILSEDDFELIVANAAHIKQVPGRKTDMNDAMRIALACGLLKASFVPPEDIQELRSLTRTRKPDRDW